MTHADHVDLIWAEGDDKNLSSQPRLHQHGIEVQPFGSLRLLPIALSYETRLESCQLLNHILADSTILASLYKKHHWLMRGHTFYQLHLLLDKHYEEQSNLVDMLRRGAMIDFIDLRHWPVFNIADCCLVSGAALLLIQAFTSPATVPESNGTGTADGQQESSPLMRPAEVGVRSEVAISNQ